MDNLLVQLGDKFYKEKAKAEKLKKAFEAARKEYVDQLDRCDKVAYDFNKRVVELKVKVIVRKKSLAGSEWGIVDPYEERLKGAPSVPHLAHEIERWKAI